MESCVIFGGAGFVGTHLARNFIENGTFRSIYLADIQSCQPIHEDVHYLHCDVRRSIGGRLLDLKPDWIFNLAAIHREPGHSADEYFETNIPGAKNVCEYAESVGCENIYFTSSISVYGPCLNKTDETVLPKPSTPYGCSKFPAELIHEIWRSKSDRRRLVISRPGVIYGPGDPGNILRMVKAIKRGYFVFPGRKSIKKSYAYIEGFVDSVLFTMQKPDSKIVYNYVENPTETIGELASKIKLVLKLKSPIISLPLPGLVFVARIMTLVLGQSSPVHPARVSKAATPTHIAPGYLIEEGFDFRYDFEASLKDWKQKSPQDFEEE